MPSQENIKIMQPRYNIKSSKYNTRPPTASKLLTTISVKTKQDNYINVTKKFINGEITIDGFLENFLMPHESSNFYTSLIGHNVHTRYWNLLTAMRGFEFIFVIDNGAFMRKFIHNLEISTTKYQKLLYDLTVLLDLITCIKPNGIDIYTTNMINIPKQTFSINTQFKGSRFVNIKDQNDLETIFKYKPTGYNNLCNTIESVIEDHLSNSIDINPLIVFIPLSSHKHDYKKMYNILNIHKKIYFVFWKNVDLYNNLSKIDRLIKEHEFRALDSLPNVIVMDDYSIEKAKILKYHGDNFRYSRGDHEIIKICLSLFTFLKKIHKYNYPNLKQTYSSDSMNNIVHKLLTDKDYRQSEMKKYAKKNKNIGKYMLDIKDKQYNKCIIS